MHFKKSLCITCSLTLIALGWTYGADKSIAVIPKGTTHVFWKSVERGAREGAKESGVNMVWKGPLKEDDRAQQIQIVEQFASQGVGGIVLAPLDSKACSIAAAFGPRARK